MILEIPYGDLLYDSVVKCAIFCHGRYFECQIMKNCHVLFYSVRHLINESRDPKLYFIY